MKRIKNVSGKVQPWSTIVLGDDFVVLTAFYLASHIWILFISNATYWDDWILIKSDSEIIIDMFIQQAATLFYLEGYFHVLLLKIGSWIYRVLTLVLMLCAGLLLNQIIKRNYSVLGASSRLLVVLLFLVAPLNIARVALVDFRYTACYFLFYLAWYFLPKNRILAAVLFFLSFNTQSLLVFYILPIIDYFVLGNYSLTRREIYVFVRQNILLFVLPFVYFAVKVCFFSPTGIYYDYNKQYAIVNLINAPLEQFRNLSEIYFSSVDFWGILLFSAVSAYFLNAYVFIKDCVDSLGPKPLSTKSRARMSILMASFGLVAFLAGSFPYWILGHVPTFNEWSSRHQLLLPLGSSLLFIAFVNLIRTRFLYLLVISFVIGSSGWINFKNYAHLFLDSQKSIGLTGLIAKNDGIKNSKFLVFIDRTLDLNALDRTYRNYEWNGILKAAFGDESRYSANFKDWRPDMVFQNSGKINKYYIAGDFESGARPEPVFVVVDRSNFESSMKFWSALVFSPSEAFVLKATAIVSAVDEY